MSLLGARFGRAMVVVCAGIILMGYDRAFGGSEGESFDGRFLNQPHKWFSIPHVGISEVETFPDGLEVRNKGTVAYKNRVSFVRLSFEMTFQYDGVKEPVVLFQFDKPRRDANIDQHQTDDMTNPGFGLMIYSGGGMKFVKTMQGGRYEELLNIREGRDFSLPQRICLDRTYDGKKVEFRLRLDGKDQVYTVKADPTVEEAAGGFWSLTIYEGRTRVVMRNLRYQGQEENTILKGAPRPVYFTDFFAEEGRSLVHWRWDEGCSDYEKVRVKSLEGELLDQVAYPRDFWVCPSASALKAIQLVPVNIDDKEGPPVTVALVDDHAAYYAHGEPQRVVVRKGDPVAQFVLKDSSVPFVVKGVNYMRLRFGDHATFEAETASAPAWYDPYDVESAFKVLKQCDYNTVRVFIIGRSRVNPGIAGDFEKTQGLYEPYLKNVVDFLQRAKKYGIYVLLAMGDGELPFNRHYMEKAGENLSVELDDDQTGKRNALYFSSVGIVLKKEYFTDFLTYIKKSNPGLMDIIWGLECQNEQYVHGRQWPFNLKEGKVRLANGREYDMADDRQRQLVYEEGMVYYHNELVAAVKAVDSELLVTEGAFVPRTAGKDPQKDYAIRMTDKIEVIAYPPTARVLGMSRLDFVDIHIYHHNTESVETDFHKDMVSTEFYHPDMAGILREKPVILGEFGSFKRIAATFDLARRDMLATVRMAGQEGMVGFMLWTYDTFEQRFLWQGMDGGAAFLRDMVTSFMDTVPQRVKE